MRPTFFKTKLCKDTQRIVCKDVCQNYKRCRFTIHQLYAWKTDKSFETRFGRLNRTTGVYYEMKNRNAKVIIIDTSCLNQKKRALADIGQNNLTYFSNVGLGRTEFNNLLAGYALKGNSLDPHGKREGRFVGCCYEFEMNEELERRYGNEFFDSLLIEAKKAFIKKHPNEILMENGRDIKDVYK